MTYKIILYNVYHLAKLLDSDVYRHGVDTDLLVILIHKIASVSTINTLILKTRADEWNIARTAAALPKQLRVLHSICACFPCKRHHELYLRLEQKLVH